MWGLQPSFFEAFSDRLQLAVYDTNQEWRERQAMNHRLRELAAWHVKNMLDSAHAGTSGVQEQTEMPITGYQPGFVKQRLDGAKSNRQAALAAFDSAVQKSAGADAAVGEVTAQIEKETADLIQEMAQFTNGAPA